MGRRKKNIKKKGLWGDIYMKKKKNNNNYDESRLIRKLTGTYI